MDQAVELREKANRMKRRGSSDAQARPKPGVVIAVTSGKGGVGKTNIVANLALAISETRKKVTIMDADLGLANIDILLGLTPRYNIQHVISGEKSVAEIVVKGPGGVSILPACSGVEELTFLNDEEKMSLLAQFEQWNEPIDYLFVDTGAGINSNVMYFNSAAQHIVVVATPDPTSITDAYAVMKVLSEHYGEKRFLLLANMINNPIEGKRLHAQLSRVADRFLDISIDYLGFVPRDDRIVQAVRMQKAVLQAFPTCNASKAFRRIAKYLVDICGQDMPMKGNIQLLWQRMIMPE